MNASVWLKEHPIILPITGGKVYKQEICNAIGLKPRNFRTRVAPILDSDEQFKSEYEKYHDIMYVSVAIAERLVREFFDFHPDLKIEYKVDTFGARELQRRRLKK